MANQVQTRQFRIALNLVMRRLRMHLNGNSLPMKQSPTIRLTYSVHFHIADNSCAYSLDISADIHSSQPEVAFIKPELRSVNNRCRKCTISARGKDLVKYGPTCGDHGTHHQCGNYGHVPVMID